MSLKVVEQYIQTLKEYTEKLKKDKITLLMQVGEFFEIYGLVYPDGRKVGNVWEFCDNVNLKVALKPQVVYDDPSIQVYMGGVGESYINPYIQKAVERFGWTIVIFEQSRIGNSNKFERREASIISPGININAETYSNITLIIYIEQIKQYYSSNNSTSNKNTLIQSIKPNNDNKINIGVAFVDCLSGENGIMAINNATASDISIPLDELLKLLTIKNPNELYIYLENIDETQISDDDLSNALHLFNYNFKILRNGLEDKVHKPAYQETLLENVYIKHKGIMDITQQLGIDGDEHIYSRVALTLLIEFIVKHDKTIIEKLGVPEIMVNSDKYLMLANNCLEQLDIIDNFKADYKINNKRLTLLELLDNTKTPLGKILLRQRLSIPITIETTLEKRYKQIEELLTLHKDYSKTAGDKYGSPLYQLRQKLSNIRNIENYLRKIITLKIQPFEIGTYNTSLDACFKVYEYIYEFSETLKLENISELMPTAQHIKQFNEIMMKFQSDMIFENLNSNVWNGVESNPFQKGVNAKLDKLQEEIDNDRGFLDTLLLELSRIIDTKWEPTGKPLIYVGENASKGIHIFTNTTRKDTLEGYFAKPHSELKVGNYKITAKDIKFLKMKEAKWEIEIPHLKTSNGTLKANIDRMGKIAKQEFLEWLKTHIISKTEILDALNNMAHFIANIDVLQSNVLNAIEKGYTKPEIDTTSNVNSYLKAGKIRHPIIEYINKQVKYIPNDVIMGTDGVDGILLFGVNAVGKSSLMKSLGINVIMAQAGMYVACSSFKYKPYKYLFTRIRNNDNLYAGLSSFEVEMKEFKVILKYADANSIILGDEIASGTVTEDATALVASGVIELAQRRSKFLFATHLHFLADMQCVKSLKNVRQCHLLVERDPTNPRKLIYNRKLLEGNGPKSYGILVCEAMNMDEGFLVRAKELREQIEVNSCKNTNSISALTITGSGKDITVGSKYNKDKVIAVCEVCNIARGCDVHHINQQCDANECDLIDDVENGIFNKNKKWNLVSLCKECHQSVHSAPAKLKIDGYVATSKGIELKFNFITNTTNPGKIVPKVEINELLNNNCDNISDISSEDENSSYMDSKNNGKLNNKQNRKDILDKNKNIPENIKEKIKEMKKNSSTPKKIQFDIKRHYKLDITQQYIRDLVV